MRTLHDGYHTHFEPEMLFDIKQDPREMHNIAKENPALCAEGARIILAWQYEVMLKHGIETDPMFTVLSESGPYHARGAGRQYADFLIKTGRGDLVPELKRRHPAEFA